MSTDITAVLPHRPPFLFIDRVTEVEPGKWARGYKNISNDEWYFAGHFPGNPVMPGVIIAEAMAQLGAFAALPPDGQARPGTPMLISIKEAQFKNAVLPGDRLDLYFEVITQRGPYLTGRAEAFVNDKTVAKLGEVFLFHKT